MSVVLGQAATVDQRLPVASFSNGDRLGQKSLLAVLLVEQFVIDHNHVSS
jgi:hypothetical protein